MRIIVATHNEGKLVEINRILEDCLGADADQVELVSAGSLNLPDPVEDGVTFQENALLKARDVAARTGCPAIADDSGLMVESLGGAPGVFSARFAGEDCSDEKNNEKLLSLLENIPYKERRAKFVSVITMVWPDGEILSARGECKGHIIDAPAGENGFGYDPLFVPEGYQRTFAQMTQEEKNCISHRAKALKELERLLSERN